MSELVSDKIILSCLKKGCPRTRKISASEIDDSIPKNTAMVKSYCPWHEQSGSKDSPELYFDSNGKQLFYDDEVKQ